MKQDIRIGVFCTAQKTFDYLAASKVYEKIQKDLKSVENVEWEFIEDLVIEIEEAQIAARYLASKEIGGLVCIEKIQVFQTFSIR
ncbi:MAG: hypothetical protein ACFFCY_16655 [Promethearchaeota archaeon]